MESKTIGLIISIGLGIIIIILLGYYGSTLLTNAKEIIFGMSGNKIKEQDPNLVTLMNAEPSAEILNYKNYAVWQGSNTKANVAGGYVSLKLTFDKDLTPQQLYDAIEVYQEKCNGYEYVEDPTGMGGGALTNDCAGTPSGQDKFFLVENRPVRYSIGYLNPDDKKKFYFSMSTMDYDGLNIMLRFKKDYIEGYCGDSCKGLDSKGHKLNPNTVIVSFET